MTSNPIDCGWRLHARLAQIALQSGDASSALIELQKSYALAREVPKAQSLLTRARNHVRAALKRTANPKH